MVRMSVPAVATAASLLCASMSVLAGDFTGFWKQACTDRYGVSIKPQADKRYSLDFCTPSTCQPWMPNTAIDGDPLYRVVDAETLDIKAPGNQPWLRYKRCTRETNPKLEWAQAHPSPTIVIGQPLNPLWFGTWRSEDGTATVTISATRMVRSSMEKDSQGKLERETREFSWSEKSDSAEGREFGYGRDRISPAKISERYEAAVRQFRQDPTDFAISDPTKSRQAIAAISPGVYRVVWSYFAGDCEGWDYIVDGDRMLEVSECKYGFEVTLYNRVAAR